MALTATILRLSEDIDLETGDMAHFIMLLLPNGKQVRALINEEAAQEIVNLTIEGSKPVVVPNTAAADVVPPPAQRPEPAFIGLDAPARLDGFPIAARNGATHMLTDDDMAGQI